MKKFVESSKSYIVSGIIFSVVFLLIFYIYRLDMSICLYGIVIYIGISIPFLIKRYFKYNNTIKVIKNAGENEYDDDFKSFSFENNEIEKEYYKLYSNKNKDIIRIIDKNEKFIKNQQEYLTMWVHQVKTPIAVMSLIAEREENSNLKTEILKADENIEQMINYMKFESTTQDYNFKTESLLEIVNNSVRKYRLLFFEKDISIEVNIIDIEILTDKKWLSYVIQQIILNSIKYTEKGGIKIYNSKDNPYMLNIADTGIGISKSDLPNIMKWGYTGENGRLSKNSTGIGLYLVNKILQKFNYHYEIQSEVLKGTKFVINLKRRDILQP